MGREHRRGTIGETEGDQYPDRTPGSGTTGPEKIRIHGDDHGRFFRHFSRLFSAHLDDDTLFVHKQEMTRGHSLDFK